MATSTITVKDGVVTIARTFGDTDTAARYAKQMAELPGMTVAVNGTVVTSTAKSVN